MGKLRVPRGPLVFPRDEAAVLTTLTCSTLYPSLSVFTFLSPASALHMHFEITLQENSLPWNPASG